MPETAQLYVELWVSLASLLRSYTAAHGLNGDRQATVELGEEQITVRHGNAWLDLKRNGARILWSREDGRSGMVELTETGRLRFADPTSQNRDVGHPHPLDRTSQRRDVGHPLDPSSQKPDMGYPTREEEMDMAAERWARELMQ